MLISLISPQILLGYQGTSESQKSFSLEIGYEGIWRGPLNHLEFVTDGTLYQDSKRLRYNTPFHKIRFDYESGLRAALEWNRGEVLVLEVLYNGLFRWREEGSASFALSNYYVPIDPYSSSSWVNISEIAYLTTSILNSGELSFWNYMTPRYVNFFSIAWMLGIRYIDLRDKFYLESFQASYVTPASVKTINQMLGGQIGLQLLCSPTSRFSWAIQVKGGAYADFVKRSSLFYQNGTENTIVNDIEHRVKSDYSLEMMPYIMYRLNPVYFKLAYDKIILFNPVFSPLQLKPQKKLNEVYTNNFVNFQTVFASIGVYW